MIYEVLVLGLLHYLSCYDTAYAPVGACWNLSKVGPSICTVVMAVRLPHEQYKIVEEEL